MGYRNYHSFDDITIRHQNERKMNVFEFILMTFFDKIFRLNLIVIISSKTHVLCDFKLS